MIDALSMEMVAMDAKPHPSHQFGKKESTIVACASNDRFGSIRACTKCELSEVWAGGAGSHYFDRGLQETCR
jgi:hypothetical protein